MDLATFSYHRVDAARRRMHVPGAGSEATGRLFFAKRMHEVAKERGDAGWEALDEVQQEVAASLQDPRAIAAAAQEADTFRASLPQAER